MIEKCLIVYPWYTLRWDAIAAFKRAWPCHGLPDDFDSLSVEVAPNGDVVDIEAYDSECCQLEWRDFDGPALLALVQDAIERGDRS